MSDYDSFIRGRYDAPVNDISEPDGNSEFVPNDPPKISEEQLKKDPDFIANAWTWFNASNAYNEAQAQRNPSGFEGMINSSQGMKPITEDEDVADWAVTQAASFNANLTKMAIDWQQMRKQPINNIKAMMGVIDAYDQTETTSDQVGRGAGFMAADPLSWVGFNILAGSAVRGLAKNQSKTYIKSMLQKQLSNPTKVGMLEGAAFGGAMGHIDEDLNSIAEQRDYNATTPMLYAAGGATIVGALGKGMDLTGRGLKQVFKGVRANGEGATFTDSKAVAESYGDDITEKQVDAYSPVFFDETTTLDELADKLDLEDAQITDLANNLAGMSGNREAVDAFIKKGVDATKNATDVATESANKALDKNRVDGDKVIPKHADPIESTTPKAANVKEPTVLDAANVEAPNLIDSANINDVDLPTPSLPETGGAIFDRRMEVKTSDLMQQEAVQNVLQFRGVDLVGYPEKSNVGEDVAKEFDEEITSLTRDGTAMTYRQIGFKEAQE